MPQKLQRSGTKQYVVNKRSGKKLSKKALPKSRALAQMRAVYARENGYALDCSKRSNQKQITCQRSKKRSRKH